MADEIFEGENPEFDAPEIYTLTDEDDNELNFALLGTLEHEGAVYKALVPVDEDGNEESEEYVILKCDVDDDGEEILVTIEDDEEFDKVADAFEDEFIAEFDYDEESGSIKSDN